MADSLQHRGPDSEGVWLNDTRTAGLSHRRLAILDVSDRNRQPMGNDTGTIQLSYNGEVYNFAALRQELQALGFGFRTTGDAEVVLRGYEAWGDDVVHRLQGMFAFGVWDEARQRLFLARDRVGIKPLYYAEEPARFLFASELKALVAADLHDTRIDVSALWDYLTYAYVPSPKSAYRSVRKLPPGHTLVLENGKCTVAQYWDVSFAARPSSAEDHVDALRALLEDVVRSSLVSDVPIGAFLSGGIDSTLVTALASHSHPAIHTFTVGFEGFEWSEAPVAQRTAQFLGTTHREMICNADEAVFAVDNIPDWFDEPFADTSALATSLVCRRARQEATVVLSGDGGDEIFGGYAHYTKWFGLMQRATLPGGLHRPLGRSLARRFGISSKSRRSLNRWSMSPIDRFVAVHGGMTRFDKEDLLPAPAVARFRDYDDTWSFRRYWHADLDDWSRLQYVDFKTYLPDGVLTKVDRTSMQTSLEVRPPLLDHRLIERVAAIPAQVRTPGGHLKDLMKKVARGLVPEEILLREKQGFSVPTEKWLDEGVFGETQSIAHWPASSRLLWCLLRQWTERRLGVKDPVEVLIDGP